MKILITGGQGYIGENLQRKHSSNHIWFDSCDYGVVHPDLPLAHQLRECSLFGREDGICKYQGIVHLAALSGLAACEKNPTKAIQENILTAMNVFALASKAGIPVVFTSSQAAKDPKSSQYAFIKWIVEQIAKHYNEVGGMNYILRLSNVYGGYDYLEKKQTCVKQFITKYREEKPLIVHGDGKQTRDFVHVWDVCEAIMNVFAFTPEEKGPIDIGTGIQTSIMDLQAMFPSRESQPIDYEFQKIRNVGADSSIANTSDAKILLNFVAKRKLEDYIKEMI